MEIAAAPSSTYLPPQVTETRSARNALREVSPPQGYAVPINKEERAGQPFSPAGSVSENQNAKRTGQVNQSRDADNKPSERETRTESKAVAAQRAQPQEVTAGGSIKLDVEDGNRVLRVFDSKDVLIYQLPPKGALMLIKAQENEQQSQVQTSA